MGKISIQAFQGNLRIRWKHERHRYTLATGKKDTPTNRAAAQAIVDQIAKDIEYEMFDTSLRKYRSEKWGRKPIKVYELFEEFIDSRKGKVRPQTLLKHNGLLRSLKEHFGEKYAGSITPDHCEKFRAYLGDKLAPVTLKQQLTDVQSCWNWAIERKYLDQNPWTATVKSVPKGKVDKPQTFTIQEVNRIIQGFRTHSEYSYYADYVEFMLGTGCRIEEAIALTWDDVESDCSRVWFGKAYYRGDEKELKAGKEGYVPMSKGLQQMLSKRRPDDVDPAALVFPARRTGGHMDDHNFRNRAWKGVLSDLKIPYRKPNTTRHTLISYWLSKGEDPLTVARLTRTSVKMIYEHYAGSIPNNTRLPEILTGLLPPSD